MRQEKTIVPDLVIAPGEYCELHSAEETSYNYPGHYMAEDNLLNSLEVFMVQQPAVDYFETLPINKRRSLDGQSGYVLAASIEELYLQHLLDVYRKSLPTVTRKKLAALPEEEQYKALRNMKSIVDQHAYESERQQAKKTVDYIQKYTIPQQQDLFTPYPHDLSRRSPFFVEEGDSLPRDMLDRLVIGAGNWGLLVFTGRKLYTSDEKAWVVLLGLAGAQKKKGVTDWHVVKGSIRSFLREAGISENGHYIQRFNDSVTAMHGAVFEFEGRPIKDIGTRQGARGIQEGWHLISNYSIDGNTGDFIITLDRGYIETFISGFHQYAQLDIKKFCKQSPTASAIHRFFAGHTPEKDGLVRMHMFLVGKATNIIPPSLTEWPDSRYKADKKRSMQRALNKLIEDGTFGPRTSIITRTKGTDDLVIIDYSNNAKAKAAKAKARITSVSNRL